MAFNKINLLTSKFMTPTLTQLSNQVEGKGNRNEVHRQFIEWRKVLTYFALLQSKLPTQKNLDDLTVKLRGEGA